MRQFIFKFISILLMLAVLVLAVSCDDKVGIDSKPSSDNMMYKFNYINEEIIYDNTDNIESGSFILDFVSKSAYNYSGNLVYDIEANTMTRYTPTFEVTFGEGEMSTISIVKYLLDDGNIFIVNRSIFEGSIDDGIKEYRQIENYLYRIDKDGNVLWSKLCSSIHEAIDTNKKFYIDKNGYTYLHLNNLYSSEAAAVVSPDGELLFTLEYPEDCAYNIFDGNKFYQKCELIQTADGEVYMYYLSNLGVGDYKKNFLTINIENKTYGSDADLPDVVHTSEKVTDKTTGYTYSYTNTPIFGGGSYDIYYYNRNGLYGVKNGEEPAQLFEWIDVGVSIDILEEIYIRSEHEIFVKISEPTKGASEYSYGRITYVPVSSVYGEGVEEIPKLSIAIDRETNPYLSTILSYAASFVRSDGGCNVEIISYSDADGGMSANQKLAKDIANNKAPDVVLFGGGISYEILSKNGAFTNLYELMGSSGNLNSADFLPCILKPFEISSGELDRIVTEFSLCTLTADRNNVGDTIGWSYADYMELNDSLTGAQYMFGVSNMDSPEISMLNAILPYMINEFVDYSSKSCDFSGLSELLELCRNTSHGYNLYLDPSVTADGRMILRQSEYTTVDSFVADRYMYFADGECVQIGYPSKDGKSSGTFVKPVTCMAIPKYCKNPETAWKFIEFVIDQKETIIESSCKLVNDTYSSISNFTCTYSGMEKWFDKAKERYYIFEINEIIGTDGMFAMNTRTKQISENDELLRSSGRIVKITDEDCAALMSLFETAEQVYVDDLIVSGIIIEEASMYYSGMKSLEETVRLIESRVNTRIME